MKPRLSGRPRRAVTVPVLAAVVSALLVAGITWFGALPPAGARAGAEALRIQIVDVEPRLPRPDPSQSPVTITARITNSGSGTASGLAVQLQRGEPLQNEKLLTNALGKPVDTDNTATPPHRLPPIPAGGSLDVPLSAKPLSEQNDGGSYLCLCATGVYPVDVVVGADNGGGAGTFLDPRASAQTFLPNYLDIDRPKNRPMKVSWVWPLIDKPHRELDPTLFDDDSLGVSVSPGGRLYRALKVAADVSAGTDMTLLIDPELLDALHQMTTGYRVRSGAASVRGERGPAAANWLRLLSVVAAHDDVSLTAYADPDVNALARTDLRWSASLDPSLRATVAQILGREPGSNLAWPRDGRISSRAMDTLVDNGATEVVLSDSALPPASNPDAQSTPNALTSFAALTGTVHVAVTSRVLESLLGTALGSGAADVTAEQALLSELAVRPMQFPGQPRYAVLVPDRYVDVDSDRAVSVIDSITTSPWVGDLTMAQASSSIQPVPRASLVEPSPAAGLAPALTDKLSETLAAIDTVRDTLSSADAATLLAEYPPAVSRGESTWWGLVPPDGLAFAERLADDANGLRGAVHIVQGSKYALASSDAPLYITVQNTLRVPVRIVVRLTPAPGERGLRAQDVSQTIAPDSRRQVAVPTRTDRSGRFQVLVQLMTPQGGNYGPAVPLRVSSSALGGAALTITIVAFGVLLLALAIRLIRRIRHRRRPVRSAGPRRMSPGDRPSDGTLAT